MSNIAVAGAAGRMGRQLLSAIFEREDVALGGAIEHPSSDAIGTDAGLLVGPTKTGIDLAADINHVSSACLLYTSPSPRDLSTSRMPSSA